MKEDPDVLYFAKALLIPRFSFERMLKYLKSNGMIGNTLIAQLASIYKVPTERYYKSYPRYNGFG